jgi:glycosyltransferase involved in cell wall biosynthesis
MTAEGEKLISRYTVVVCSLVRNVSDRFSEIVRRAEKVAEMFADYRIVMVENDSTDGTRKLLKEWRKRNSKVIILGCGVNSSEDECHIPSASTATEGHLVNRRRIEKMVHLRNVYLNYVKTHLFDSDFTIVWDLDVISSVYLDGIANTIAHFLNPDSPAYQADAIGAYGIYRWGFTTLYYDTYAHIDFEDRFHIDLKTIHDIKKWITVQHPRGTPPLRVRSCFGGFTIYRTASLLPSQVVYEMSPPDNLECEHVLLHRKLRNVFLNPSMIHFILLNR